jgi:hypothetical protein
MKKNNDIDLYLRLQEEYIEKFQKELSDFKDDLDKSNLSPGKKSILTSKFIKDHNTYKTMNVKYSNFILDIRKPSFFWFMFWVICSIIGFIKLIKWIINIF